MTTLFPRGYGGTPSYQFSSPDQFNTRYYQGRHHRRQAAFVPRYPNQPLYQPPYNYVGGYPAPVFNQYQNPGFTTRVVDFFNELDEQYRYEGYLRQLEKLRRQQMGQLTTMPLTTYPALLPPPPPLPIRPPLFISPPPLLPPPPRNYPFNTIYDFVKETQYVPYPIYLGPGGPGGPGFGTNGNLGQLFGANVGYGTGGASGLLPKVRVIFIPAGQSYFQQPYTGSLAMPPFLYNRIAQPFCSFPLPPPLPQIGSLPLTPAVQQMVMQRYSNPVAVFPFTPNWQMPPSMMPSYPMGSLPQQQSLLPATGFPSLPPAPQAYIPAPALPSALISAIPQYPPAPQAFIPPAAFTSTVPQYSSSPQAYIPLTASVSAVPQYLPAPQYLPTPQYLPAPQSLPAPVSAIPSFQPTQQTYIPPAVSFSTPISAFQSLQTAPQAYIPPSNIPVLSAPSLQLSSLDNSGISSSPQYSYSGYPSMCRACPPAPPPLNITVTGHCWVQHCCACHHVPTVSSNPNVRPGGGRITPLLRHPTVPQYVPEQINQHQQRYLHSNAPVMMRPWLRKTPPLPPGAVIISDEYIDRPGLHARYALPPRQHREYKRSSHDKRRSATVTSKTTTSTSQSGSKNTRSVSTEKSDKNNRSVSPKEIPKNNNNNTTQQQEPVKSNSTISTCSTSTSTSDLSAEYNKTTLQSPTAKQNTVSQKIINGSRNINLQYKYQPQELSSVYLLNRYLKSSSEGSIKSENSEARSNDSSPFIKERSPISSPSSDLSSVKKEPKFRKKDGNSLRPPSQPNKSKERLIIIREFRSNSPSTISTISSDIEFSIINKDEDTTSTASTIKANKL